MATRRRNTVVHTLGFIVAIAGWGCNDTPSSLSPTQLERGGAIDFACLCETDDGGWEPTERASCDAVDSECSMFAFVLQVNRGEIAIVNLDLLDLHDSDMQIPFTTFPHVGDFPTDLAVTSDGSKVVVTHAGESTLAIVETSQMMGPRLPDPVFLELPGPARSISIVEKDGEIKVFLTLPSMGSIAWLDLDDPLLPIEVYPLGTPSPDPDPDPGPDAGGDTDGDIPDASEDAPEDVPDSPSDVPEEADPPGPASSFTPLEIRHIVMQDGRERLFVSGFDAEGGGGVVELDMDGVVTGSDSAMLASYLPDVPVGPFTVFEILPDPAHAGAPSGTFLYAADRDEQIVHVVALASGEELDTTGGNPLVSGGGIRTSGLVVDMLALDLTDPEPPEDQADLGPFDLDGVFVFLVTSTGILEAIDVYDRNCWDLEDTTGCLPHVVRNSVEGLDSQPRWYGTPALWEADGQATSYTGIGCIAGMPCIADTADVQGDHETWGVTFWPDLPGVESPAPDIRRPLGETWYFTWEGNLPWTSGAGGNLSDDGSELTDPGLPFCALGIRGGGVGEYEGDLLVIEDGPDPLSEDIDCGQYPQDGGAAYRIVEATQTRLALEPVAQWSVEGSMPWLPDGYPAPREECFPFAARFHVRASERWVVTGSTTGLLHDTVLDGSGRCADSMPGCGSWDEWEAGGCTLLTARAAMERPFVNPYIRFTILANGVPWDTGDRDNPPSEFMKPGMRFQITALGGFIPMTENVATLPGAMSWLHQPVTENDSIFISDRSYDGLVEFDPFAFRVVFQFE